MWNLKFRGGNRRKKKTSNNIKTQKTSSTNQNTQQDNLREGAKDGREVYCSDLQVGGIAPQ